MSEVLVTKTNKNNKKLKIALIGPYPPPHGGIAVHIQRLKEQLEEKGLECVVYHLGGQEDIPQKNILGIRNGKRWLSKYFFTAKEDVVHYHNPDWRTRVVMGLMALSGRKTVISIHGASLNDSLKEGSWLRRQVIKFALRHTSFVIANNEDIRDLVLSLGVKPQKVAVISPFIPPTIKEEDYNRIPRHVRDFMESHQPVISANAFRITFHEGIDLYGLDMIVGLAAKLRNRWPKLGIMFCLPGTGDSLYLEHINQIITQEKLSEHILLITQPINEAYPIWQESDIFLRPTVTDGDSVSLREALYFKVPSIASDACPRPKGTVLFKNRDLESLVSSVEEVWSNYSQYKKNMESIEVENGLNAILEVYHNLASGHKLPARKERK